MWLISLKAAIMRVVYNITTYNALCACQWFCDHIEAINAIEGGYIEWTFKSIITTSMYRILY